MEQTLLSWVGKADLEAAPPNHPKRGDRGPLLQALAAGEYDYVRLLINFTNQDYAALKGWFRKHTRAKVDLIYVKMNDPTDFDAIYKAAVEHIGACQKERPHDRLTIHLSPGTPAMAAVWILLAKTRFDARLIQSSKEQGVKVAAIPFDISAEYLPDLIRARDERLADKLAAKPAERGGFSAITYRSPIMQRLVDKARRVARHTVPVLIEGESGTGKELLARSIHEASLRSDGPFVAVNCGAIPKNLVESQLFGHKKGAFTDAIADNAGFFEAARGGTLFLDEVGELALETQVKLLRVLQEKTFTPLGATKPVHADVRIISATNRSLIREVSEGNFREDLFYRLAVASLNLPPLREREGDIKLLISTLLASVQNEILELPEADHKKLSVKAEKVLLLHDWPGNVRELQNTLARAVLWSDDQTIGEQDARDAILVVHGGIKQDLLTMPLDDNFNLLDLLEKMEKHYIQRALEETHWKLTPASRKLGLNNYQTLSNKMKKYGIE